MSDMPGLLRAYMALEKKRKSEGLSPTEMTRWAQLKSTLNRHFQPDVDTENAEKRASVRIPIELSVQFESRGEVRDCLMTNVSAGGIFVASDSPLAIGTRFNVRIKIERTGDEIELPGEVASLGVSADLAQERQGMGIRFVNLTAAQQSQVDDLYKDAMRKVIERAPEEADERAEEGGAADDS